MIHGIDFLREYKLNKKINIGKNAVIIGGGNTAIDAARTAKRLGAENIYILYRRTRQQMPASNEEINAAIEEGIKIEYLTAPIEVISKNNKIILLKKPDNF